MTKTTFHKKTGWVKWLLPFYLITILPLKAYAQDDKGMMFNPVEHAVVSQTIAPDARAAGMGDVGVATDPDVNSQYWNPAKYPFCISRAGIALNYTPWLRKLNGKAWMHRAGSQPPVRLPRIPVHRTVLIPVSRAHESPHSPASTGHSMAGRKKRPHRFRRID